MFFFFPLVVNERFVTAEVRLSVILLNQFFTVSLRKIILTRPFSLGSALSPDVFFIFLAILDLITSKIILYKICYWWKK